MTRGRLPVATATLVGAAGGVRVCKWQMVSPT